VACRLTRPRPQLCADSELSVKNGAELLDRLVKDIVSESAATYVSVLVMPPEFQGGDKDAPDESSLDLPTAFSLPRFMPLLKERIYVLNPYTRTFLVGWIVLLDSIPDLELVTHLPEFLGGLLRFLSDSNRDVHVATQGCLEKFLNEIRRISAIRKGITDSRKSKTKEGKRKRQGSLDSGSDDADDGETAESVAGNEEDGTSSEDDWLPGQDVQINYRAILEILTATLDSPLGKLDPPSHVPCRGLANPHARRGQPARIAAVDCRVSGHHPGRGPPLYTQDTCSPAARHGKRGRVHPAGSCQSQ